MRKFRGAWLLLLALSTSPLFSAEPEVLGIDFSKSQEVSRLPSWVKSYEIRGGEVQNGAWTIPSAAPIGLGQLDLILNPDAPAPSLAVTIALKDQPESDLSIQLYNAAGELVAVDLFGNLLETAREGRTDTFIVPLAKFPTATRLSVRRIKGPLEVQSVVIFPVMEALNDLTVSQKEEFARWLGERLEASGAGVAGFRAKNNSALDSATASLLDVPDYPVRAWNGSLASELAFPAWCSGTCYRFFTNLYFSLFPDAREADKVAFVSSTTALDALIDGTTAVALMSVPPNDAQRAEFQEKFGHAMVEIPIAVDAVDVLVHVSNKLPSIAFPDLRRVFSSQTSLRYWDPASGLKGPVMPAGGSPSFGTSIFFAGRVMNGESFRPEMVQLDVSFPRGVEEFVSQNSNAIGFAQHRVRTKSVRMLPLSVENGGPAFVADAVTVNNGTYPLVRSLYLVLNTPNPRALPEPVKRFVDFLLSREGQTAVAETGSFPLPPGTIRELRSRFGLP